MYNSQKQTLKRLFGLEWFAANQHLTPVEAKIIIDQKEEENKQVKKVAPVIEVKSENVLDHMLSVLEEE